MKTKPRRTAPAARPARLATPGRPAAPALVLALALALALAACGSAAAGSQPIGTIPASGPAASGAATQVLPAGSLGSLYPRGQLRQAYSPTGSNTGVATLHGYYELRERTTDASASAGEEAPCNILYTDYTTRQQAVLCGDPGCSHSSEACTGWLPRGAFRYILAEAAGGLVLIDRGGEEYEYDQAGQLTHVTATPGPITTMDYGGGNRQVLYLPPGGRSAENGFVATDDAALYLVYQTPPPNYSSPYAEYDRVRELVRVDLATGEGKTLCTLDPRLDMLEAVYDGKLLFRTVDRPRDDRELGDDFAAWEANLKAGVQRLFTVDPAGGEKTMLPVELPDYGFGSWLLDGRTLYYTADDPERQPGEAAEGSIYQVDLPTGVQDTYATGLGSNGVSLAAILEGRMVYMRFEMSPLVEGGHDTGAFNYTNSTCWLDMATRHTTEQTLAFTYTLPGAGEEMREPVALIADAGEHYLVRIGYLQTSEYSFGDLRALIAKADFWAGEENYIPITVLG